MADICLQNIVTVRDYCAGQPSTASSGYDLFDAPEISLANLAGMAKDSYLSGLALLRAKMRLALLEVQNDFINFLQVNRFATILNAPAISTGRFTTDYTNPAAAQERGITLYRNPGQSGIRKLRIRKLSVFPIQSVEGVQIRFYDNGYVSAITVNLVGGQINNFDVDYTVQGNSVRILMDNAAFATYSSVLTCMTTCTGAMPNDCGYVKGYNGSAEIQKEGFGINAEFSCDCDYTELLCSYSKNYVGKIVWTKARALLLSERINSQRLNPFIIYGRDDAIRLQTEVENEYREAWNNFALSLPELLKYVKSDCIACKGVQIVTNL